MLAQRAVKCWLVEGADDEDPMCHQNSLQEHRLAMQGKEKESAARIKKFMTMMDSMTDKELDSSDIKLWQTESRIMRIARGAGVHPNYVGELIGGPSAMARSPSYDFEAESP